MAYDAFISYSHAADGALAPALRKALRGLARPWYRTRALHVFLDEANLSASEDLPNSIRAALSRSRYFVHLASPLAAQSRWVGEELEVWHQAHGGQRLLIALTDGDILWDTAAGDFDASLSTAIHPRLRGVFEREPLWVDLRWAKSQANLSPRDPRFQQATAMLAAPMHGKGVDELVGDDVRAHRNTRRVIHSVVAALASLLLLLSATALLATRTSANLQSKLSLIETILPFFDKSAQDDENLDRPPWATLWQTLARQLTPVSAVEQRVDWGPERLAMREDCRLYEDVSDADRRFECPQNNSAYGADGLRNDIEGLRQIVEQLLVDLNSGRVAKLLGADSSLQAIAGADDSVTEPDADISTDQAAADRSSGSQSEVTLTVVHEFASILLPEPLWAQLRFKGLRKSRDDNELYGRYFRLHVHAIENGVLPTALVLVQMEDGGYCGSGGCQSPSLGFLRRGSDYTLVWVNPLWGRVILYPQGPGNMPRILAFGTSQSGASSQFRQVIRYDFDAELGQYQPSLRGQIESNESHGDPRVPGLAASSAAARPSLAPSKPSASELTHR